VPRVGRAAGARPGGDYTCAMACECECGRLREGGIDLGHAGRMQGGRAAGAGRARQRWGKLGAGAREGEGRALNPSGRPEGKGGSALRAARLLRRLGPRLLAGATRPAGGQGMLGRRRYAAMLFVCVWPQAAAATDARVPICVEALHRSCSIAMGPRAARARARAPRLDGYMAPGAGRGAAAGARACGRAGSRVQRARRRARAAGGGACPGRGPRAGGVAWWQGGEGSGWARGAAARRRGDGCVPVAASRRSQKLISITYGWDGGGFRVSGGAGAEARGRRAA
jgi:hypothetical protein